MQLTLAEVAEITGGSLKGDSSYKIGGVSPPNAWRENTISPLWEKKYFDPLSPGVILLTKTGWLPDGFQGIEADDPRAALAALLIFLETRNAKMKHGPAVHPNAVISEKSIIGKDVYIGAGCIVEGSAIGDGAVLEANVFVGADVTIGAGSRLEPGVVVYHGVTIGGDCIIHAGAVIGCDGFGFVPDKSGNLLRMPQIGTVRICDNVEIGACSSVDRATFGETVIGRGTKIDSHVKIGHNCKVGEFCIIVSQSGVAGSSVIGSGVTLGAQSGVANHATIGDGVTVAGRGGVTSDIEAGKTVSGFPARDHREELRERVALRRLPELMESVKGLKREVAEAAKKREKCNGAHAEKCN